jgi:sugar phosphate isomerase/epimerase
VREEERLVTDSASRDSTGTLRLGIDGRKLPRAKTLGPIGTLERAHELGFTGVFFRSILDLSPALEPAGLREVRARADALGMYLEAGLGKVNPYATPEAPELRALGGGDLRKAYRMMMEAAAGIGVTELWVSTANFQIGYDNRFAYDRFRTDADWRDQLTATVKFMRMLAPVAADLGVHMNVETHEEITSFEVVEIVERVGPEVAGIVYDTANPLQRIEHPAWTAKRVAPYVRQTHLKDCILQPAAGGVRYQMRPCGQGIVDFDAVLAPVLAHGSPNLSIEAQESRDDWGTFGASALVECYSPAFLAGHPDLSVAEFAAYMELVQDWSARQVADGLDDVDAYHARPFGTAEATAAIEASATHLREVLKRLAQVKGRSTTAHKSSRETA